MANGVRIRRDVWKLAEWDPILEWYARAIAEMQKRPLNDPTSWRYQAGIHEYRRTLDPFASAGDTMPTTSDARRFWNQCQHSSWFFLPWHRMYLAHFEGIVASTVASLGGPTNWSLPYWNYSDTSNPNARSLPPAFFAQTIPDGSPNPLLIEGRNDGCNDGEIIAAPDEVDLAGCLGEASFVSQGIGGSPGFGGPVTQFNHGGGAMGFLEAVPHGSMHMAVGGFMGGFNTAGLDPLFWLHHANIDRLWDVWRGRNPQHTDPVETQWLSFPFEFHDRNGNTVALKAEQVVDTTSPLLGYKYEDVTDPLVVPESVARRKPVKKGPPPEMVGATEAPIALTGGATTARLAVVAPTGPARTTLESTAGPPRIYLNIENITGSGKPTSYSVYVNVPPGTDPRDRSDLLAGVLPMFGVSEATQTDRDHPGGGLHYALEIGDLVRRLQAENAWNPETVQITFVPRPRGAVLESPLEAAKSPIVVGRVSLYLG